MSGMLPVVSLATLFRVRDRPEAMQKGFASRVFLAARVTHITR